MGINYAKINQWILTEDTLDPARLGKCEAVMSLGNGYLGLRSATEERYVGETRNLLINGTFNKFDKAEVTELPNAADVTAVELWFNGFRFSLDQGTYTGYSRELNIRTGELTRFGGLRMLDGKLRIRPRLPRNWEKLSYTLLWKGQKLQVTVTQEKLTVQNLTQTATVELELNGTQCTLGDQAVTAALLP